MDRQKIDRLFREKLGHLEAAPSAKAWSQVEKQIRPKKTPIIYWVAASVTILFISWAVWPEASRQIDTLSVSEISHPVNQNQSDFELPTIKASENSEEQEKSNAPVQKVQKPKKKSQPAPQFAVNKTDEEPAIIKDAVPELEELDTQTAVAELEEPSKTEEATMMEEVKKEVEKPSFTAVKITYIASASKVKNEEVQKNDSTGVLKKFIAFTEKIDPGEMLADIKTAKDNLFNGGLKNKKERTSL